jgi:hypothetical protein
VKNQNTLEYLRRFSQRPVRFFRRQTMKNQKTKKILKIWKTVVKLMAPSSETVLGKGLYDIRYMTDKCVGDFGSHCETHRVNDWVGWVIDCVSTCANRWYMMYIWVIV